MSILADEIEKQSGHGFRRPSDTDSDSGASVLSRLLSTTAGDESLLKKPKLTLISRSSLRALLPTWLHSNGAVSSSSSSMTTVSKTAWLDGLRGTAAFCVFAFHYLYAYYNTAEYGFGSGSQNKYIFQLPILRVWLSGPTMVAVFFVISGYALSYKAIGQIRRRQHSSVLTTVSSSTFRRAVRLYLPTWTSLVFIAIFMQMGVFDWGIKHATKERIPGWREDNPPIHNGFWSQMKDVSLVCIRMANPFKWEIYWATYDLHLWTIPTEFRCSLVVFLSLVGLSRVKSIVRMGVLSGLAFAGMMYCNRWDVALFLMGMVICEVNYISSSIANSSPSLPPLSTGGMVEPLPSPLPLSSALSTISPPPPSAPSRRNASILRSALIYVTLLFALFLCSIPRLDPDRTPLYSTLYKSIPRSVGDRDRFYTGIGSVLLVFCVSSSPILKKPFESRFAQYLGKISFSLYLVHGAICRSVGYFVVLKTWEITGRGTFLGKTAGTLLGAVVVGTLSFWFADVFTRLVDGKSVAFARWIENKCLDNGGRDGDDAILPVREKAGTAVAA